MKNSTVYCLICPDTLSVKYVGITTKTIQERLGQHIYDAKNRKVKSKKVIWIKKLLDENKKPEIKELFKGNLKESYLKEKEYIRKFLLEGCDLTNSTFGGDGVVLKRSKESIERSSSAKYKPIIQLDLKGNFISEFKSIKQAADTTGLKKTAIGNCLKNRSYSSGGFIWIYKQEYTGNKQDHKHHSIKEILVYDINGDLIGNFPSIDEILKNFFSKSKKSSIYIKDCLLNVNKTFNNCYFRYSNGEIIKKITVPIKNKYIIIDLKSFKEAFFSNLDSIKKELEINYLDLKDAIDNKKPIKNHLIYKIF